MEPKQSKKAGKNLGTLSSVKTNQDYNQKKPSATDPNELKSKTNPQVNKKADIAKSKLQIRKST